MGRFTNLKSTVVTVHVTALVVFAILAAAHASEPHIVVFISDDHTLADSSVYGATDIATPGMQRMADRGMTFQRAFVASPSCAPSRATLLTGLMPARNGAEANHTRPLKKIKKLPAYLQELGYEVVAFGKVGHYSHTPEYGFDLAKHFTYHDDVAIDEALNWLNQRESDKPLCLFVGTNWPHVPWPPARDTDAAKIKIPSTHVHTPKTRLERAKYYQAISMMDNELGRVFDAAYSKLGDNTLFIHTSDHGAQWPFAKWNLYDDGIRTPLIAVWPNRIVAGTQTDAMVSWVDLLPTIVDAAGGKTDNSLDGRSFLPVLLGDAEEHRQEIYTTHSGDGNYNVYPSRSLRNEQFKYIRNLHPEFRFESHVTKSRGKDKYWSSWVSKAKKNRVAAAKVKRYQQRPAEELYDLVADPRETKNLAGDPAQADRLAAMRGKLTNWLVQQGDQCKTYGMPTLISHSGPPPNVITVFIDDMGWSDLSCFNGVEVETTNIDQLASEGLRFTNFYVNSPICSPSRTALTTGQYPARHRITSYLANRQMNQERGIVNWLDPGVVTLPRSLAQVGYKTGHFGKWHMGGQRDVGEAPLITEYGFEVSLTNFEGLGPRLLPLCDAHDGQVPKRHDLGSAALGKGPIEWVDRSQVTARYVQRAIEFIEVCQDEGKPFFINVWPDDVHSPFYPPESRRNDESKKTLYYGVLKTMDEQLGKLFDRVRSDDKLRNNTLILLCSDNGPEPGAGSSHPLRGAKGLLYEGGIRSPLIVWGPGLMAPSAQGNSNDTTIVSSVDLVASVMSLANFKPPKDYHADGEDLLTALLGVSKAQRGSSLFWRRPPDRPGKKAQPNPDLAMRDGPWKLLCQIDGSKVQLYNLGIDLGEQRNLAGEHKQVVQRMKRLLLEWNASLPQDGVSQRVSKAPQSHQVPRG